MKIFYIFSLNTIFVSSLLFGGGITGKVSFDGKPPKMKKLRIDADPVCAANNSTPPTSDWLIVDGNGGVKNVLVYVKEGAPKSTTPPADHATIDQYGCVYNPHVLGVQVGQQIDILNNDGTLHNIHALPKINREFNKAMPKFRKKMTTQFDKAEDVFKVKCDVHPWMGSYVGVFDHPFFTVSSDDGTFSISGLSPGTYTIEAWHEKLKTKSMTLTVGDEMANADFVFSKPQKTK
jgi:plastocyanin